MNKTIKSSNLNNNENLFERILTTIKNFKFNRSLLIKLIIVLSICLLISLTIKFINYETNYVKSLSDNGLSLLNSYEFPWYNVDDDNQCMAPYDINDGAITFGPGVTYSSEQEGIDDINSRFNTQYTTDNDCIDLEILFNLQSEIMGKYEKTVYKFAFKHKILLEQNEFDALVLIAYNSPDFLKNDGVLSMLESDSTQEQYINTIDSYYQTLNSYYDNPETKETNDGFGEGWYRRIVDSSEVYFYNEYEYQNSFV